MICNNNKFKKIKIFKKTWTWISAVKQYISETLSRKNVISGSRDRPQSAVSNSLLAWLCFDTGFFTL